MDKKQIIREVHRRGLHDGFINFWMGMLDDVLENTTQAQRVFEYGSLNSRFLEFLEIECSIYKAKGIVMRLDDRQEHHNWSRGENQKLTFSSESAMVPSHEYDIGFSQEVFSLLPDIAAHARYIWDMLSPTGVYYSAFGWHKDNPCSIKQEVLRNQRQQPFFLHALDDVVEAFHAQGFEVGIKRLTLPYFMIYDPQITPARYGNVGNMISCIQDNKILFSFRKLDSMT